MKIKKKFLKKWNEINQRKKNVGILRKIYFKKKTQFLIILQKS